MFKKISEFFRVVGELKYIIPLLRYKWPELDSNSSLAHSFQETVQKYGEKDFLYFEDEVWTYAQTNEAANILANKLSNEGIAQFLFFKSETQPETTYKSKNGKYQGQTTIQVAKIK